MGAVSSVGQSRGLIIPWSLVRAQHGLPFSLCFNSLSGHGRACRNFLRIGQNPARMAIQPDPGARSSWAIRCVAIRRHNPAVGPLPAVGPVVAGTCRGDAAPPVLSAVPCAPPPVPSAQSCAVRFVAAVNPFIIKTTGWHAVFAACRAWLRFCRMALHRFITQTAVFSFLHQGIHLAIMPKGSQIGKNSVFSVAPHGLERCTSLRLNFQVQHPIPI